MTFHDPINSKRSLWPDRLNPLDWNPFQWASLAVFLGVLFLIFPETDLQVSGLFFDAEKGGWHWRDFWLFQLTYKGLPRFTGTIVVGTLILWVWGERIGRPVWGVTRRVMVYIILVIALGPGLIANSLLKDNWGRARPSKVEHFGGELVFTPPFIISDQCEKNCSFVSGHASMGFATMMFGFLTLNKARRRKVFVATFMFGVIVGLGRIGQGRHFFSDTIYAFYVVFFTSWLLHGALLYPRWLRWNWLGGGKMADT